MTLRDLQIHEATASILHTRAEALRAQLAEAARETGMNADSEAAALAAKVVDALADLESHLRISRRRP